jgi:hypothetical protein
MQNPQPQKQWWAPVWTGLVMDGQAKHYRRMKSAVWLYLYLVLNANRQSGLLVRKLKTISQDMCVSRDTVLRWLTVLRTNGYVETVNTGHSLTLRVTKWKGLSGVGNVSHRKSGTFNSRSWKYPTPELTRNPRFSEHNRPKTAVLAAANKTIGKINLINEMREGGRRGRSNGGFEAVGTLAGRELLAHELAHALDDPEGITLYRSFCARFPERLLRDVLSQVQQIPTDQITKGRGALFTYLVQNHVKRTTEDLGH